MAEVYRAPAVHLFIRLVTEWKEDIDAATSTNSEFFRDEALVNLSEDDARDLGKLLRQAFPSCSVSIALNFEGVSIVKYFLTVEYEPRHDW